MNYDDFNYEKNNIPLAYKLIGIFFSSTLAAYVIICLINSVHYGCIVVGDSILVTDYIVNMHSNDLFVVENNMTDS